MRSYFASLILGVGVGVVYGIVKIRSPAPPVIALIGLLGMLAGERAVSLVRSHVSKSDVQFSAASRDRIETSISDDVGGEPR
jgi:XapX domain-containing protein